MWIKAHVGYEGNKIADELAKQGTTEDRKTNTILSPLTSTKDKINKYIRKAWDQEWRTYTEAKHTKELHMGNDAAKAKKVLELSRFELAKYCLLYTSPSPRD